MRLQKNQPKENFALLIWRVKPYTGSVKLWMLILWLLNLLWIYQTIKVININHMQHLWRQTICINYCIKKLLKPKLFLFKDIHMFHIKLLIVEKPHAFDPQGRI